MWERKVASFFCFLTTSIITLIMTFKIKTGFKSEVYHLGQCKKVFPQTTVEESANHKSIDRPFYVCYVRHHFSQLLTSFPSTSPFTKPNKCPSLTCQGLQQAQDHSQEGFIGTTDYSVQIYLCWRSTIQLLRIFQWNGLELLVHQTHSRWKAGEMSRRLDKKIRKDVLFAEKGMVLREFYSRTWSR